jgi:hypothetical protein
VPGLGLCSACCGRNREITGVFTHFTALLTLALTLLSPTQARDLDVDNTPKPGESTRFALQKLTLEQTKARVAESLKRLTGTVAEYSSKKYWSPAQNELRRQIGYLRFDLSALVDAKGSGEAEADALIKSVEELDFAFRKKSPEMAAKAVAAVADNAAAVKAIFL